MDCAEHHEQAIKEEGTRVELQSEEEENRLLKGQHKLETIYILYIFLNAIYTFRKESFCKGVFIREI